MSGVLQLAAPISPFGNLSGKNAFSRIALTSPKFTHRSQFNIDVKVSKPPLRLAAAFARTQNNDRGKSLRGGLANKSISTNHTPPLELQSTERPQCLEEIVTSNAQLSVATRQQLELLAKDQQAHDKSQLLQKVNSCCAERILHRRIAEVKAKERTKAVEEIMYALVMKSFMQAGMPMVRESFLLISNQTIEVQSMEDQKLEALHFPLVKEMIKEHVAMVIGGINTPYRMYNPNKVTLICRERMGQIYAASVMYGYFLRRVLSKLKLDQRFQTLHIQEHLGIGQGSASQHMIYPLGVMKRAARKGNLLAAYVMSFHEGTLKQNAKIRSREGLEVIERHAQALFGRPGGGSGEPLITLRFWGIKRLVLEALAFGTLLWDVEESVELHYALTFEN